MSYQDVAILINKTLAVLFFLFFGYQYIYVIIAFLKKPKPQKAAKRHRFAVLISARNEEKVIGQLLKTINAQDYPSELITTYVIADNCTDSTAQIARDNGAVVYERFDNVKIGKGYALNYLLKKIFETHGEHYYDAFFVFDADNLLESDYITEMNRTFSSGYNIVTGYRNSKNYGDNWISAGYGMWFMRQAAYLDYPRMLLGNCCSVSGTGFMFSGEVIRKCGGWNFFLLTEDIQFSVYECLQGERIGFCKNAQVYDEQPVKFRQSWRQRMRWTKGGFQVFAQYGGELLHGMFSGNRKFSCFDLTMNTVPAALLTITGMAVNFVLAVYGLISHQPPVIWLDAVWAMIGPAYSSFFAAGLITTITEWKRIHCSAAKKVLYTFTFPVFAMTFIPITIASMMCDVSWKPIEHNVAVSLDEVKGDKNKNAAAYVNGD